MLIRLLSHKWILEVFNYQDPSFYARLFGDYEEGPFEVLPGSTKFGAIIKSVPTVPKCYDIQESNSACVLCSLSSEFFCWLQNFSISF